MKFNGERCIIGKSGFSIEKEHLARYNFALNYVENKTVLDIACGSGYGTKILANSAKSVIGVDISQESIDYAKTNFSAKNITFKQGNAEHLDFLKDHSIDLIISFETIEHLKNHELFLQEIKRILKKNGQLIISTPNKPVFSPNSKKPANQFHVIEFSKKEFEDLLNKYFQSIYIYGQEKRSFFIRNINRLVKLYFIITNRSNHITHYEKYLSKNIELIRKKHITKCLFLLAVCKK